MTKIISECDEHLSDLIVLMCSGGLGMTSDIEPFLQHVDEMLETGVQATSCISP